MAAARQETPSALEGTLKAGATLRLPTTVRHRQVMAGIWRRLADETSRPLASFAELSALLGAPARRHAPRCWREVSPAGTAFRGVCTRQRQVEATVVAGVWRARLKTPVAGPQSS